MAGPAGGGSARGVVGRVMRVSFLWALHDRSAGQRSVANFLSPSVNCRRSARDPRQCGVADAAGRPNNCADFSECRPGDRGWGLWVSKSAWTATVGVPKSTYLVAIRIVSPVWIADKLFSLSTLAASRLRQHNGTCHAVHHGLRLPSRDRRYCNMSDCGLHTHRNGRIDRPQNWRRLQAAWYDVKAGRLDRSGRGEPVPVRFCRPEQRGARSLIADSRISHANNDTST